MVSAVQQLERLARATIGVGDLYGDLRAANCLSQRLSLVSLLIATSLCPSPARAEPENPTAPIVEGQVLSQTHGAGESVSYAFEAQEGQTYLIEVTQGGLDLTVSVGDPGSAPRSFNSPSFRDDRETALLEPVAGDKRYTIEIVSGEYTGAVGKHSISVSRVQNAATITAYRYMADAAAANHLGNDENWQKSLSLYTDALSIWRDVDDKDEQARTLLNIANLQYWQFASWHEAAESAADAAEQYAAIGNSKLYANAIHLQAASLIEAALATSTKPNLTANDAQSMFEEALHLFDGALRIQVSLGNQYDEARTLNNIGLTYYYMDDWSQAGVYFKKAAAQFRDLNEWSDELQSLANLAVIDFELGRFARAIESFTRLLELIPADRNPGWRADTLDNLGASLLVLGQIDGALKSFFEALALHELVDSAKGQGRSLTGIGSTYYSIGEMELARQYFDRALPIREQVNDGRGQVAVLHFLGDIHRHLRQFERALYYHNRALGLAVTPMAKAKIEILRARDWIDAGDYEEAAEILGRVTVAARRAFASAVTADATYELGRTLARSGDTELAQSSLEDARKIYEEIGSRDGQARSLLELGQIREAVDIDAAIEDATRAIEHIEQIRSRVANPELRAVYLSTRRDYYEFLIHALMQAHDTAANESEAQGYLLHALSIAERARARATADLMSEAAVEIRQGVDPKLQAQQYELYGQLAEKQYTRDQLLEQGMEQAKVDAAVSELQDIHTALDVLEVELRRSNPKLAMLSGPEVLRTHQIQEQLDDDSVVLQYWLGDSASYLWIVSHSQVQGVRIASRTTIDELAREVYESLSMVGFDRSSVRARQAALESLSELVVSPAAEAVRDKIRVIVAADGSLQYVPFSLLSPDGQTALIDSHEVVVVPSITALAAQRQAFADRVPATKTLAAIGDPVFSHADPRLTDSSEDLASSADVSPENFLGLFDKQIDLSRLPFSAMEIEHIAGLVSDRQRLVATGFEATRENIVKGAVADYRFIHFGTHGLINARHPALSTLVFSLVDETGNSSNGFLRLHDIYNLELAADLVVLSACETGLGREIRGEGLVGLTQGFMYAGAKSVVASLWRVSDRATAELMTLFYRYLLEDGDSPASALRRAQLDLAAERRWRDPYFWSGFVLHGDWT